jgi:hypothetical protein
MATDQPWSGSRESDEIVRADLQIAVADILYAYLTLLTALPSMHVCTVD